MVNGNSKNLRKSPQLNSLVKTLTNEFLTTSKIETVTNKRNSVFRNDMPASNLYKSLIIALLLMVVGVGSMSGATITATVTGNWSNTATWGGAAVPVAGDAVTINNGINVTIDVAAVCNSLAISNGNTTTTLTISGSNSLTVSGAVTIGCGTGNWHNKIIAVGAGAFSCASITVTATGNSKNSSGVTISSGTVTVSGAISMGDVNDDFTFTGSGTLNVGGDMTGGTFTSSTGTVNYNGAAQTVGIYTYNNLTLSGTGAKTLQNGTTNVNGILSMEGASTTSATGTIHYGAGATLQYKGSAAQTTGVEFNTTFTGSGGLIIDNTFGVTIKAADAPKSINLLKLVNGILNTSNKVLSVTNTLTTAIYNNSNPTSFVNGPINWSLPVISVSGYIYNFPVGSGSNYLPFALVNPITSGTVTAQVQAFSGNSGGSTDATLTSISNTEYWSLNTVGNFTNSSVSIARQTAISPTFDAVACAPALTGTYTTLAGLTGAYGVSNSNTFSGTPKFFVLAKGKPTIFVSTNTLTGFSYPVGLGPSSDQSFSVSGTSLTTNISIVPDISFEISLTGGASFAPRSIITLYVYNGTVVSNTIYVRMKAGLALGTVNGNNINCSSAIATQAVSCSGVVVPAAVITVSTTTLSGFHYNVGAGPSTPPQTFTVSGTNITNPILITAPTDYQLCLTVGGVYSQTLSLSPTGGNIGTTTIYVRLTAGLPGNIYNENIALTTTNGVTQTVATNGSVSSPTITVSTFNLGGFIYNQGAGPSGVQTFTVSASNLAAILRLRAPINFEISSDNTTFKSSTDSLTFTPSSGTVNLTTLYVRMVAGLGVGFYGPGNLTAASIGSITQNVALSGQVAAAGVATIISSPNSLNGFVYIVGNGPSEEQSFTVSGTSLTGNLVITPPGSDIQISFTSGTESSAAISIPNSGKVNAVTVYVRLIKDLLAQTYPSQNIVLSSSSAFSVPVVCNGEVILPLPSITATANGANPLAACDGSTVNLNSVGVNVSNRYWTGPNGYYSPIDNPSLGAITALNAGTYSVTGSALSGVNLLTNGDFEQGNTGFGSSYAYLPTPSTAEGVYFVVASPQSMHSGFCVCPDKTSGSGKQMVINGNLTAGIIAWSESVAVIPGANYQFSYWIQTVSLAANPAQLQLYVNGVPAGPINTATTNENGWQQFFYNTNAGSNNVLQLTLININTVANGNDFALDNMVFQQAFPVTSSVSITDNITLPVSVSIIASSNPVYSGGLVEFNAIPVNGGSNPTFQWLKNNINVGTNSSTFTYTPVAGDVIRCVMTSNYPCTTGSPSTSNQLTTFSRTNFWVGTTSSVWGDPTNWSAGYIPAPGNDVEFATNTNNSPYPAINNLQVDVNRTIGNLVNASPMSLIVPTNLGLIVNYSISTDPVNSHIIIQSAGSPAINGSLIFSNSSSLPVNATVEMYSKAWKAYPLLTNKYQWQYFGVPLTSVAASPTFDGSYVRSYNEASSVKYGKWTSLINTDVLSPFKGYEITQDATKKIIFQGLLFNNDSTITLNNSAGAFDAGQNILSNPYTAAIDIRQLTNSFGANTEKTIYLYNTGSFGDWVGNNGGTTYSESTSTPGQYIAIPQNTAGTGSIPYDIPSMSGFLVKVTSPGTGSIALSYNSIVINNISPLRAKQSDVSTTDKTYMEIAVNGEHSGDCMWLFNKPGASKGFDNGWDGYKMAGALGTPQIFAMEESGNYQVSTSEEMNNTYLGFQAGQDVEYTLKFTHQNLKNNYAAVFLVDLVENKTIDITESDTKYTFLAESTSTAVKRFKIATRPIEKNAPDAETQLKVFSSGNTVFVQNLGNQNGEMVLYDIMGRYLKKANFSPYGVTAVQVGDISGAYIVNATTSTERVGKRLIIGQ